MRTVIFAALAFLVPAISPAVKPYFQQQVNYRIRADLDPESARIAGSENITYFNNSQDTLREIYFHVYYNAFKPGSYLDQQYQARGDYEISFLSPREMGFVAIDLFKHEGVEIDSFTIDNTIMRAPLLKPLFPGDSTSIYIEFTSQVPSRGNRAARRGKHFDVGQWYPKPAVYDRYGWHINQYLYSGEFFSEFGNYDVEITLPADFIVAHTGRLLNESEVFGGRLPIPDSDSIIVDAAKYIIIDTVHSAIDEVLDSDTSAMVDQNDEKLKTWKIEARNIHDFAFCADPEFVIDICRLGGITIKAAYPGSGADRWQRHAAEYTRKALEYFSERYYPYLAGQFTTVQSVVEGGMEFPEMVMISGEYGRNRFYRDLELTIAHEAGHNWFYGILAFNETEEGFLDEGLTTMATIEYLEHYYGRHGNSFGYEKSWQKKWLPTGDYRNESQLLYLQKALSGTEDPMVTPANLYRDTWGYYNAAYYKSASVFFMLQYTLGEEKFNHFLQALFDRWAFRHPYLSDIQDIAEEAYGRDLRWFFRQWFTTTWTLDYALDSFDSKKVADGGRDKYEVRIGIKNLGQCISPLDVVISSGGSQTATIFVPVSAWSDGQSYFDTTIALDFKPSGAAINPDLRLADTDRLNNATGLPKVRQQFMVPRLIYPDNFAAHFPESYTISHHPSLWYNIIDGIRAGYDISGSYLDISHKLDIEAAVGLKNRKVDYKVAYSEPLRGFNPQVSLYLGSKEWEGRGRQELGIRYDTYNLEAPNTTQLSLQLSSHYLFESNYLYRGDWSPGEMRTLDLGFGQKLTQRYSQVYLQSGLSASVPGSDYRFSRVEGGLGVFIPGLFAGRTRLVFKGGIAEGEVPLQRRFYLSTADPFDIWESPLFRSRRMLPDRLKKDGHLLKPGGAWMIGYYERSLTGAKLLSGRITSDLPPISLPIEIPVLSRGLRNVFVEAYFAGGYVWDDRYDFDNFLWESGLAFDYSIPFLGRLISENRLSLYLPLWLSDPEPGDDNFAWRWMISFSQ